MATHSDASVRLQHKRETSATELEGARKNVETAKKDLENRSLLEKSADALTGFSSEKMLKANLEEAEKREKEMAARVEKLNENTEWKSQEDIQAMIDIDKKAGKAGLKTSMEWNKRVQELADTSVRRAATAGRVAEAVQDVNAGIAYTGGTILWGPGWGVAATAYVRWIGWAVESATESYLNDESASDIAKNAALGGAKWTLEGTVEWAIYTLGWAAWKTVATKIGSKVLGGTVGGAVIGGGMATQREATDMLNGGESTAEERLKRIGLSTLAGAAGGAAMSKVPNNIPAQAAGGATVWAATAAGVDLATTGETSLESILIGGTSGAAGAFGSNSKKPPTVDDGYTIESGYLPLQNNKPTEGGEVPPRPSETPRPPEGGEVPPRPENTVPEKKSEQPNADEPKPHKEQQDAPDAKPRERLPDGAEEKIRPLPLPRNTTLRDIGDVPREARTHHVGDTNGSYEWFLANMRAWEHPLIDADGNWQWGSEPLVLTGDILGDRNMGWVQTYEHIARLREQWANIHVLAGNHEDFVIGYLTNGEHAGGNALDWAETNHQWKWLLEFGRFADPHLTDGGINSSTYDRMPFSDDVLHSMRNDTRGRVVLEEMAKTKLAEQIDDTLYVHTDPNHNIVQALVNHRGVDGVNQVFQANMRRRLLGWADPNSLDPSFYDLRDVFLHTYNGRAGTARAAEGISQPMTEMDGIRLRSRGINRIIHGHTDHTWDWSSQTIYIGGVEITSIDYSTFKSGYDKYGTRSAWSIETDGTHVLKKP